MEILAQLGDGEDGTGDDPDAKVPVGEKRTVVASGGLLHSLLSSAIVANKIHQMCPQVGRRTQ